MSNASLTAEEKETRLAAIYEEIPGLMALRHGFQRDHYREPIGVVLPATLNPDEGEDATDARATLMGLPITWGDCTGLIYGGYL